MTPTDARSPDRQVRPWSEGLLREIATIDETRAGEVHRVFVVEMIAAVVREQGVVRSEQWYRELMTAAGVARKPSSRTMTACIVAAKESRGEARGPAAATVMELRGKLVSIETTVKKLGSQVERMAESMAEMTALAARQLEISEAINKRHLEVADMSHAGSRNIDDVTSAVKAVVQSVDTAVRKVELSARDMGLDAARVQAAIQRMLERLAAQSA